MQLDQIERRHERMKRMKIALFVASVVVALAFVGTAAGAAPQVNWLGNNLGPVAFAEASWETRTATSITDAGVLAAATHRGEPGTTGPGGGAGTHIFVDLRTMYLDGSGQPVGGVDVSGNANGGVPFTIDALNLTTASVNTAVPATTCTLDASGNPTSCVNGGSLNVAVSWTGQGDISRGSFYEDHFLDPGSFVFIDRSSGTFRQASATATIGGQNFDTSTEVGPVDMGKNVNMTVLMCPHGCT
jgi:hypothetical protein